jgi:four helix bundle protein
MKRPRYDFEKLQVYQEALAFAEAVFETTEEFPYRVQSSLGDQLRRAALSICNNIAEGSGKQGPAKRQFYGYSLDSARECVPMFDLSRRRRILGQDRHGHLDESCFRLTSMLYALMRSVN